MGGVTVVSTPEGGIDTAYGPTGFKGLVREPVIVGLSVFASLGGVLFGYDQGVLSGVLVMDDFVRLCAVPLDPVHIQHPLILPSCIGEKRNMN